MQTLVGTALQSVDNLLAYFDLKLKQKVCTIIYELFYMNIQLTYSEYV